MLPTANVMGRSTSERHMSTSKTRTEHDSLGPVEVPADRLWGPQTERARLNFADRRRSQPVGPASHPRARHRQEVCGTRQWSSSANCRQDKVDAIVRAAQEVIDGKLDTEFPLSVFQTGSGTQTNMNANEVIAHRAVQLAGGTIKIHPNDDVNRSQSSNDVFPTVMHIATVAELDRALLPAIRQLRDTLDAKSKAYSDVVMIGRTHLQDATPLTVGQMISGWVAQLDSALAGIERTLPELYPLALGGTAVGTGLNAPAQFGDVVARQDRRGNRQAVRLSRQQVRRSLRARCDGRCQRVIADAGGGSDEDRQRCPLVCQRAAGRHRRIAHPRQRAGLVDHARQGESDSVRSANDGRRPGLRQRSRRRLRRIAGPLPTQRVQAGDSAQRASLDRTLKRRHPFV